MRVLTREQVRRVDRLAIEELGIPGVVLMENAGRNAAGVAADLLEERGVGRNAARVAILCGGGNNGGDGYVIARHLHNIGVGGVTVYAAKEVGELSGDAAVHARVCVAMGLPIVPVLDEQAVGAMPPAADLVVDALLGTGFRGEVRGHYAGLIRWCNGGRGGGGATDHGADLDGVPGVVAVDVPSGLDCDTGVAADPTVRADVTVTFVAGKVGFTRGEAGRYVGRVVVADIGSPPELIDRV